MQKLRTIIIDDEQNNCDNLKQILTKYCDEVNVVAIANNAFEGYDVINQFNPDLVFLDIQMPGCSGIEMLEKMESINFDVIFVTAFDEFAIKAIRLCAIDYLLKPIDIFDLKSAVAKVLQKQQSNTKEKSLEVLLQNSKNEHRTKKIALPTAERILFVRIDEIIRCLGENNYTSIFLNNGEKVLVSKTLKEYEELLQEHDFLRVHQSHLINLQYVRSYEKQDGGYIKMTDDSLVSISRQRKPEVLKRLS